MSIIYKEGHCIDMKQLENLYLKNEWFLYTKDIDKLNRSIQGSLYVKTAWDNNQLVGLIRVVGDGESIVYIQDILVRPEYQRQGIGTVLMNDVLERFKECRQKTLLTGQSDKQDRFYRSLGFKTPEEIDCVAFVRHDI